jgi:hypothetical protein
MKVPSQVLDIFLQLMFSKFFSYFLKQKIYQTSSGAQSTQGWGGVGWGRVGKIVEHV